MNIPPKYEDLVLKVAELERRDAALREELASANSDKEAYGQNAIDLRKKIQELNGVISDRIAGRNALQQRLTVAEQRAADLKKLLCDVINEAPTGFSALKVDLANRVNSALKPAAEG